MKELLTKLITGIYFSPSPSMPIKIKDLKDSFLNQLQEFPFPNEEEPLTLGIKNFKLYKEDTCTALETPFTFRKIKNQKISSKTHFEYKEEESSEGESTDDEGICYYEDIKMDIDLFINNRAVVEDSTLHIFRNHKYGLVGRNGIGKSTLLRALRKRRFGIPKSLKIYMLKQDFTSHERVIDFVGSDAGKVLQNLGFDKKRQESTLDSLSGGWRMRAQLAKAIHTNPDLLLLDEPTNFLDIRAINFLESQMKNLKTVIVVSHDRSFLNNTVDTILHLNNLKIETYNGNYDQFIQQRINEKESQQREYENIKAQREHIQSFIDRFRYNAKRSSQAQSRIKLLEKLPKVEPPKTEPLMKFRFKSEETKGILVELDGVSHKYTTSNSDRVSHTNNSMLLENISLKINSNSRIVIVGENGMGKSTLLKIITENITPVSGKVIRHPSLRIGYFAQHHLDHLDYNLGALSLLMKTYDEETSRAAMSNFGLHINNQKIGTLSGGQKSRLAFASLSLYKPNLLILDEPTNHLDMETIDALADALMNFQGAVVCVSHDLSFIEKVFNEVYICENGRLDYFRGTPREYKESIKKDVVS